MATERLPFVVKVAQQWDYHSDSAKSARGAQSQELRMEFLEGETEARYAWATVTVVAQRERRARIAAQVRPIVMGSAPSPYKDPCTGRERFEEFFRRPTLADYPPGWQPCSAKQLHDALEAGWKPMPAPPTTAYQVYLAGRAGY